MEITTKNLSVNSINWGGVWAGLFAGLGIQAILTPVGFGVWMMSHGGSSFGTFIREMPIGMQIWAGLVWLFSTFLAGYVAAWMAGACTRAMGVFHGFVTWGVMVSIAVYGRLLILAWLYSKGLAPAPLSPMLQNMAWWLFISGILSLGLAYLGGRVSVRAAVESWEHTQEMHRAA